MLRDELIGGEPGNKFISARIVAAIDFTDEADRSLEYAIELASSAKHVTALHVASSVTTVVPGVAWQDLNANQQQTLREAFARRYSGPKYRGVQFEVRFGDIAWEIAAYAKHVGAGLIVLSSHRRTGLARTGFRIASRQ